MDKIIFLIRTETAVYLIVESSKDEALERIFGRGSTYNSKKKERETADVTKLGVVTADVFCDVEYGTYITQPLKSAPVIEKKTSLFD